MFTVVNVIYVSVVKKLFERIELNVKRRQGQGRIKFSKKGSNKENGS